VPNNRTVTAQPARIGLFGGTFDPVHAGHVAVAEEAVGRLALDEVRFLPCRQSPHKARSSVASGPERCEMLRLATAALPWAVVDDFELSAAGPSFSVHTAEEMARRFPGARLFWLMGSDQWEALPRWQDPQRLAQLVEFAVFPRGEPARPRAGFRLHLLNGSHPASASAIRANPAGASETAWLAPRVANYIKRRGLYAP
jgi:nicotinate-nucleotide adenylyltransferase